jgi:hypothetical protein
VAGVVEGTTLEESEHMMATRPYQNTARAYFDAHRAKDTRGTAPGRVVDLPETRV